MAKRYVKAKDWHNPNIPTLSWYSIPTCPGQHLCKRVEILSGLGLPPVHLRDTVRKLCEKCHEKQNESQESH